MATAPSSITRFQQFFFVIGALLVFYIIGMKSASDTTAADEVNDVWMDSRVSDLAAKDSVLVSKTRSSRVYKRMKHPSVIPRGAGPPHNNLRQPNEQRVPKHGDESEQRAGRGLVPKHGDVGGENEQRAGRGLAPKYGDVGGEYFKPMHSNHRHSHECLDPSSDGPQKCYADVVFLGVSKCGTTSMAGYMRHHPKLKGFRPLGGGEDQIFDKPGLTDEQLAKRYWAIAQPQQPINDEIVFHYDPQYSYYSAAPSKMYRFFPQHGRQLKFMMLIRDPVRRTHSSFYHRQRDSGTEYEKVEEDLGKQMQLFPRFAHCFEGEVLTQECDDAKVHEVFDLGKSLYGPQLEVLFDYFEPRQFLIMTLEQFQADKRGTFKRVLDFLGADELGPRGYGDEERLQEVLDMKRNSKPTPEMTEAMKKKLQLFFGPWNEKLYRLLEVEPYWPYEHYNRH